MGLGEEGEVGGEGKGEVEEVGGGVTGRPL